MAARRSPAGPASLGLLPSVPAFFFIREARGGAVCSSAAAVELMSAEAQTDREWLQVLYLDAKNQLIEKKLESWGSVDSSAVYPREVMRSALMNGAAALIVAHNHPTGDPEPSLADKEVTRELVGAGHVLGVKVLDHIIIGARVNGAQRSYSFADTGLIDDYASAFGGVFPWGRP